MGLKAMILNSLLLLRRKALSRYSSFLDDDLDTRWM
jgi:hypothetical protein